MACDLFVDCVLDLGILKMLMDRLFHNIYFVYYIQIRLRILFKQLRRNTNVYLKRDITKYRVWVWFQSNWRQIRDFAFTNILKNKKNTCSEFCENKLVGVNTNTKARLVWLSRNKNISFTWILIVDDTPAHFLCKSFRIEVLKFNSLQKFCTAL